MRCQSDSGIVRTCHMRISGRCQLFNYLPEEVVMKYVVEFWSSFLGVWCFYMRAVSQSAGDDLANTFEAMYGEEARVRRV